MMSFVLHHVTENTYSSLAKPILVSNLIEKTFEKDFKFKCLPLKSLTTLRHTKSMATLIEEIEELDDKCYLDSHHGY